MHKNARPNSTSKRKRAVSFCRLDVALFGHDLCFVVESMAWHLDKRKFNILVHIDLSGAFAKHAFGITKGGINLDQAIKTSGFGKNRQLLTML